MHTRSSYECEYVDEHPPTRNLPRLKAVAGLSHPATPVRQPSLDKSHEVTAFLSLFCFLFPLFSLSLSVTDERQLTE